MVLKLNGNSEIGKRVSSNICDLICLRHLIRSIAVTIFFSFPNTPIFLFAWEHVPSYNLIQYHGYRGGAKGRKKERIVGIRPASYIIRAGIQG